MARLHLSRAFDIRDLPETRTIRAPDGLVFEDGATRLVLGVAAEASYRPKVPEAAMLDWGALSRDGAATAAMTHLDLPGARAMEEGGAALARLLFRGDDLILGSGEDDRLLGFAGDDALTGGAGADVMTGGGGADAFRFVALSDSAAAEADRITDFRPGRDTLDLHGIDAVHGTRGDQAFAFVGGAGFTGTPGELRWDGRALRADVDGDGRADFALHLGAEARPEAADLLL